MFGEDNRDYKLNKFYRELIAILFLIGAFFLLYFLILPTKSGIIGSFCYEKFDYLFGSVFYFIPFLFLIISIKIFFSKEILWKFILTGSLLALVFLSSFFELLSMAFNKEELGGAIGVFVASVSTLLLGTIGTYIICFILVGLGIFLIIRPPLKEVFNEISKRIKSLAMAKSSFKNKDNNIKIVTNNPFDSIKDKIKKRLEDRDKPNIVKAFDKSKIQEKQVESINKNDNKELSESKKPSDQDQDISYITPSSSLLEEPANDNIGSSEEDLKRNAKILQDTFQNFGVDAKVGNILPGPVITRYEVELSPGVKVNTILNLSNDISLAMKSPSIRILAPIPGKSAVGVELPNPEASPVLFKEIVESKEFRESKSKLSFILGKTVAGRPYVSDIAKTPHLLIAGSTGSGKSVCINALIMSILYKSKPDEVKFILVDPKMVELSYYQDMPHLYSPVITSPKQASKVLQGVVDLMEKRYEKFAEASVRNIESYNYEMQKCGEEKEFYLVVIIDELADLMLVASKDVEESIVRLTQKARAVGIHLVLATQRPSVDVITGVIKANLPSRISFQVMSKGDSRVVLDMNGAEALLGKGDMLYLPNGSSKPVRIQGAYLSEKEVKKVLAFMKKQGKPDYDIFKKDVMGAGVQNTGLDAKVDEELRRALEFVVERRKVSYELLRANGFSGPKATNIISLMEVKGFIEKPANTNKWEIYFDTIRDYLRS